MEIDETEKLIGEMKSWAERLAENTSGKYPDRFQMKAFLQECGFDFEKVRGHEESMKKWTDKGMSEAMNAILGEAKWEGIKNWNEEYIKDYEQRTGHILPSIPVYAKGTKDVVGRSKQSSMKHVLGVMVKWAALSQEDDPEFTENSLREEFEVRIVTGEVYHPSLPPDYPVALIDKLLQKQSPS